MKYYAIMDEVTAMEQVLNEQELMQYYGENITEYDNISDWIFDSVRNGLLKVSERDDRLSEREYQYIIKAAKIIPEIEMRGDLLERFSDREDFIETSIWSLEKALIQAFMYGYNSNTNQ